MSSYESKAVLDQYLLFHYGEAGQILPYEHGPSSALGFAEKVVSEFIDTSRLGPGSRALDLGCSVGRSSFEFSKHCDEVIGIDYSNAFINAAKEIQERQELTVEVAIEGSIIQEEVLKLPQGANPEQISFEVGDAQNLRDGLGQFDVLLMSNLVDRLPDPAACLENVIKLLKPGGQLIIASPYTWLEEYTEKSNWLSKADKPSLDAMKSILQPSLSLESFSDLPFLIRETARKYQWSVSQVSSWRKGNG